MFNFLFQETGPLCACLGGAYRAIHVLKAASGFGTVRMSFSDVVAESEGEAYESLGSGRSWRPQKDAASVRNHQHFAYLPDIEKEGHIATTQHFMSLFFKPVFSTEQEERQRPQTGQEDRKTG